MAEGDLPDLISIIGANIEDFIAKMDEVNGKIDDLSNQVFDVKVGIDGYEEVSLKIDELDEKLDEFGHKDETAKVKVDTGDSQEGLGLLASSILALGPAGTALGATLAGSLVALPAIFAGIASGAGAVGLAFKPVEKELENDFLPALNLIAKADQETLLPMMTEAAKEFLPVLAALVPYILGAAQGIGLWAEDFSKLLASKSGLSDLNAIFQDGAQFMQILGQATLTFLQAILNLGGQAGPIVEGIANAADAAAKAFLRWTTDGNSQKFIQYLVTEAPLVAKALGGIADAAMAILKAFASVAGPELQVIALFGKLLTIIIDLNPQVAGFLLTMIGVASLLVKLNSAFTSLAPLIAKMGALFTASAAEADVATGNVITGVTAVATTTTEAEVTVGTATEAMGADFAAMLGPIGLVVAAIGLLAYGADQMMQQSLQNAQNVHAAITNINNGVPATAAQAQSLASNYGRPNYDYNSSVAGGSSPDYAQTQTALQKQAELTAGGRPASNVVSSPVVQANPYAALEKEIEAMAASFKTGSTETLQQMMATTGSAAAKATGIGIGAAGNFQVAYTASLSALTTNVTDAHKKGLSELNSLLQATHSGSLTTLNAALTSTHLGQLQNMVTKLNETHASLLKQLDGTMSDQQRASLDKQIKDNEALGSKILTAVKDAQALQVAQQKAVLAAQSAAEIAATVAANSAMVQAVQKSTDDLASAAVTLQNDTAKLTTDQASGLAGGVGDQATILSDKASAQVQAIQDQSQILTDTMAEQGQTGAALLAQQAQVALDIQKQTDDAKINADTIALATQKASDDILIANATQHADQVAIQQDQLVAAAEAAMDTGSINEQSKVNTATIANAIAQAGTNLGQQTLTANALLAATQEQTTTMDGLTGAVSSATDRQSEANSVAAASLAEIQGNAATMEAALAAILSGDQGAAAIAEAQLAATLQQLTEEANLAAAATTAATAAVTAANSPTAPILVTVVTQIDGQQIALTTTPLIRQELLRTTARQTQNIYGQSAGQRGPT